MRIDGLGAGTPISVPVQTPPPAQQSSTAAFLQAVQQEQQKGGGGGGGHHGRSVKNAQDPIEEIAARAALNIERRKTVAERQAEIERLRAQLAQNDERVGEKDPDSQQQRKEEDQDEPGEQAEEESARD